MNVIIRHPKANDKAAFLSAMKSSRALHGRWVRAPATDEAFNTFLEKYQQDNHISYLVLADEHIAGVININQIIRGPLQSAFLGYYAVKAFVGKGIMTTGLKQVVYKAFHEHGLHRLEANIQPGNNASIQLVKRCGFNKEGFSPKYLNIFGEWRDHERWAIIADNVTG